MDKKVFQIKEVSDKGLVRAVIATLNVRDKDGDVTLSGAFGNQDVVVLPTHNWGHVPIGKGLVREEDGKAIAEIQMNMEIPAARDWFNALKFDLQKGQPLQEWSYGFTIKEGGAVQGEWEGRQVRFLKPTEDGEPGLKVHEVSPVLVGAGQDTGTLAVKENKGALRSHKTPVVETAWSGPTAIRNARSDENQAYYSKIFAWRDPRGEEGSKSSYKLPHHEVDADGTPGSANVRGLIAAIGALNGARGGVDVPQGDRRAVYNHLAAHLRDADIEPPELREDGDATPPQNHEPEEGKRFCDEAEAALGAVMSLTDRAKSLADLRAKEGRKVSEENRERLLKLSEALDAASVALKGILIPQCDSEALKERLRYERFRANKLRGDQ